MPSDVGRASAGAICWLRTSLRSAITKGRTGILRHGTRRDESRRCTQECVRHDSRAIDSGRDSDCAPRFLCTGFAEERESRRAFAVTHANGITTPNLSGCDQIRERLNEQTLDGALQVTRSVPEIRTFGEQERSSN